MCPRLTSVKILVVVEGDNARAAAMRVGADAVVMMPITAEALLQKINDMALQPKSFMERKKAKFQKKS
jgi:hypothetical protein